MKFFTLTISLCLLLAVPTWSQQKLSFEVVSSFGIAGLGDGETFSAGENIYKTAFNTGINTQLGLNARLQLDKKGFLALNMGTSFEHARFSYEMFSQYTFQNINNETFTNLVIRNHNFQFNNLIVPISLSAKVSKFELGAGVISTLPLFTQVEVKDEFGQNVSPSTELASRSTTLKTNLFSNEDPRDESSLKYRNLLQFQYLLYINYIINDRWRVGLSYQNHIRSSSVPLYGTEVYIPLSWCGTTHLSNYDYRTGTASLKLSYKL